MILHRPPPARAWCGAVGCRRPSHLVGGPRRRWLPAGASTRARALPLPVPGRLPLVTGAFIALRRDVKAAGLGTKVVFMEITVDPRRHTPARFTASQGVRFRVALLTGTPTNLDDLGVPRDLGADRPRGAAEDRLAHRQGAHVRRQPHGRVLPNRSLRSRTVERFEPTKLPRAPGPEADESARRRWPAKPRAHLANPNWTLPMRCTGSAGSAARRPPAGRGPRRGRMRAPGICGRLRVVRERGASDELGEPNT